ESDPNAVAGAPGNAGLPAFEATQGRIGVHPESTPGATVAHRGAARSRFEWGGKPIMEPAAALSELEAMPDEEIAPGIPDPVDLVLRGFRAYYPLNYPGSGSNFTFTFGESIRPNIDRFKTNNPFGRGHSSGCTSCHMTYDYTGA